MNGTARDETWARLMTALSKKKISVTGEAYGCLVTVNGHGELLSLSIDREAVKHGDPKELGQEITTIINRAQTQAQRLYSRALEKYVPE